MVGIWERPYTVSACLYVLWSHTAKFLRLYNSKEGGERMQFELLLYVVVGVLLNVVGSLIAEWIIRYIKRRKEKKNQNPDR